MTPVDTWLVCGLPVRDDAPRRGCTCTVIDPTPLRASRAMARLASTHPREEAEPVTAPPARRGARKAGR